jgi:predicted permease
VKLSRIWLLLRGLRLGRQLDEEIQAHLDLCAEDYRARGLTPGDARAAARRAFGGIDQVKEQYRDQLGLASLDILRQDLRYTFRTFRRTPGFTATAVLSLALGLGANAAIFGVMDALLLKTLPVARPEQLFALRGDDFSYPAYERFRQDHQAFDDLFATSGVTELDARIQDGPPERTAVSFVSGSYFTVLGVTARVGRAFVATDDRATEAPIAVLSDGYWTRRFGRDPSILGRTLRVGNATAAIVGVTPRGFFGERVGSAPDLWMPLTTWGRTVPGRDLVVSPTTAWLQIIGRLKPGREIHQVEAALTLEYQQALSSTFPHAPEDLRREINAARVTLEPAARGLSSLRSQFSLPLEILMAVAAFVLLIACANVANVLIARAAARQREIALRLALGISRGRLVRQLLTESVMLSLAGGALGLMVAWLVRESLLRLVSADGTRVPLAVATDGRMLAFASALSVLTGLLFGLAPIWQAARVDLVATISTARTTTSVSRRTIGLGLVIAQIALSVVLLTSATLFLRTLSNLRDLDLGFTREHLLIVDVNPRAAGYHDGAYAALCERLLERLTELPGVAAATLSENGVLTGRDSSTNRMRPDDFVNGTDGIPTTRFDVVGPRYFTTLGVPLRAGRDIDAHDVAAARAVIVINEAMARRFFGNQNPLGRTMLWGPPDDSRRLEVVGVSGDVRQHSPRDPGDWRFYVPYFQHGDAELASARFLVRTAADPSAMMASARQAILAEDESLPIERADTAQALVDRTVVQERMIAVLSTAFTGLALLLACIGLYGLISYRVVQRTGEIGVRMALGASRRQVLWMVLRHDAIWIAAGIAIGGPSAVAASRFIRSLLFGIDAASPSMIVIPILVMVAAGVVAGAGPAARAARIDPAVSLRHD